MNDVMAIKPIIIQGRTKIIVNTARTISTPIGLEVNQATQDTTYKIQRANHKNCIVDNLLSRKFFSPLFHDCR